VVLADQAASARENSGGGESGSEDIRSPQEARRILIYLIFPAMLMPMVSTMTSVALPVMRDDFGIQADVAAWIPVIFTLPFMILMPVYGRLGDGLGKRRLILVGITIFALGTAISLAARDMSWLMLGRAVQGIGLAGMMPLGMALVSSIFPKSGRGKALGTWSTVGPTTAFLGPLVAGFLVAAWGWRGVFVPHLAIALVAFLAVYRGIPSQSKLVSSPSFVRSFDWGGVVLLGGLMTGLIFFLSSRSITGVAPLRDWRLLLAVLGLLGGFLWWERGREDPFMPLGIFADRMFLRGSVCACLRMFSMGALSFLMPLYLVDIQGLRPAELGGVLMIGAGAMSLVVRLAGGLADRWSSRWLVVIGLAMQVAVMVMLSRLPGDVSLVWVGVNLGLHGIGAGLMLATLHRVVMTSISQERMGAAAGLYNMLRFLGAAIGIALSGVLLQGYLDAGLAAIEAYQNVFFAFAGFPALGIFVAFTLREPVSG
jgi:MFS family permease